MRDPSRLTIQRAHGFLYGYLPFFFYNIAKLALTSPTGGCRYVDVVRSPTQALEFSLVYEIIVPYVCAAFLAQQILLGGIA
jgi:hypothetical protein